MIDHVLQPNTILAHGYSTNRSTTAVDLMWAARHIEEVGNWEVRHYCTHVDFNRVASYENLMGRNKQEGYLLNLWIQRRDINFKERNPYTFRYSVPSFTPYTMNNEEEPPPNPRPTRPTSLVLDSTTVFRANLNELADGLQEKAKKLAAMKKDAAVERKRRPMFSKEERDAKRRRIDELSEAIGTQHTENNKMLTVIQHYERQVERLRSNLSVGRAQAAAWKNEASELEEDLTKTVLLEAPPPEDGIKWVSFKEERNGEYITFDYLHTKEIDDVAMDIAADTQLLAQGRRYNKRWKTPYHAAKKSWDRLSTSDQERFVEVLARDLGENYAEQGWTVTEGKVTHGKGDIEHAAQIGVLTRMQQAAGFAGEYENRPMPRRHLLEFLKDRILVKLNRLEGWVIDGVSDTRAAPCGMATLDGTGELIETNASDQDESEED